MKSWPRKSARACAAISLLAGSLAAQAPPAAPKAPILALLDAADAEQWRTWTGSLGWRVVTAPAAAANQPVDNRILALQTAVQAALTANNGDPARVYLGGRGDAASAVFYAASRLPDLWAAGIALGGSLQPAIDTYRFFPANSTNLPVLWVTNVPADEALAGKLKAAGLNLEYRAAAGLTVGAILDWASARRRDAFPATIDCETTSPQFGSCYWIRMTKFDPSSRNDVLISTRLQPRSNATLDLGDFAFKPDDPGPGVQVVWLPDKYSGQLKLHDRIVSLGGKPVKDAREFAEILEKAVEERPVVASVQRGSERIRIETRIVLPKREETVTARVQGTYLAEEKEIQILSRTIVEMRITVPEPWVGATLNWNGTPLEKVEGPGCRLLVEEKQLQSVKPCP